MVCNWISLFIFCIRIVSNVGVFIMFLKLLEGHDVPIPSSQPCLWSFLLIAFFLLAMCCIFLLMCRHGNSWSDIRHCEFHIHRSARFCFLLHRPGTELRSTFSFEHLRSIPLKGQVLTVFVVFVNSFSCLQKMNASVFSLVIKKVGTSPHAVTKTVMIIRLFKILF